MKKDVLIGISLLCLQALNRTVDAAPGCVLFYNAMNPRGLSDILVYSRLTTLLSQNNRESAVAQLSYQRRELSSSQQGVNTMFQMAAQFAMLDLANELVNAPQYHIIPDQDGVNNAFGAAAEYAQQSMLDYLLRPRGISGLPQAFPLPNQDGINLAFKNAARSPERERICDYLLSRPAGIPLPDQTGVDAVLSDSLNYLNVNFVNLLSDRGHARRPATTDSIEYILRPRGINVDDLPVDLPLPGASAVASVLNWAAVTDNITQIEIILRSARTDPHDVSRIPFPSTETFTSTYRNALPSNHPRILDLLRPYVPAEELEYVNVPVTATGGASALSPYNFPLIAMGASASLSPCNFSIAGQGFAMRRSTDYTGETISRMPTISRGIAFEIHDYMRADVPVAKTAAVNADAVGAGTSTPTRMRLNDAVLHNIKDRVGAAVLPQPHDVEILLNRWVNENYTDAAQNALAIQALNANWETETPQKLALISSFLETYHFENFDTWMKGFVGESLEAYKGRSNPLSCIKGIDERIVTGLRGIDAELDALFAVAESPEMIKRFFTNLNIGEAVGATFVAEALKLRGITAESPAADAVAVFKLFVGEHIISHGVDVTRYENEILHAAATLGDFYEEKVRGLF